MTLEKTVREVASLLAPAVKEAENKASRDVFGTAMVSSSGAYVMLDGAAEPVRCSFSVNCLDGDRVVAHIVNHKVVVFSNLTNPDMSSAEVISHVRENPNTGVVQNIVISDSTLQDIDLHGFMATDGTIENTKISGGSIDGATLTNIPYAAIENLDAHSADIADARIGQATIKQAQVENLVADKATINGKISAAEGDITNLQAKDVEIEGNISAATARIGTVEADYLKAADMTAEQARVNNLLAGKATVNDLNAATGRITKLESADATITGRLEAAEADIDDLEAEDARIANLVAGKASINDLNAATGRITVLESTKANIADIEANYITADDIEATYMHANMSNSDVAWIQNGVIANGAISSAMINDVSANKLTAGTINGSVINVTNLNADNITTGTINGQRIGEGSLSLDKLSEDVYTEAEVDAKLSSMQAEIDGAIETWTGTEVPKLNNAPASAWTTTADRDKHVGDVYFNTTSGYNYRFTKSGSTYSWLQIKDTDITNALNRIQTAEGKITTFDSDISTLKTDTGELKTKTQSLETSLGDKVDTTTFNELEDTVDGHSQTISQHTTAISQKADTSTVNQVTNRVTKAEQDISGINTTIGQLQTTVESKADGSALETVSSKLNTVSDTVDGHTQTISSVQSTLSTKADNSTVSTLRSEYNQTKTTVSGHETRLTATESVANGVRADFDNLEIGGRNLFQCNSMVVGYLSSTGVIQVNEANGERTSEFIAIAPNTSYVLQYWTDSSLTSRLCLQWYDSAKSFLSEVYRNHMTTDYYSGAFTSPGNAAYARISARWLADGTARVKLERGNKPTDWTPAPEDLETEVTSLKTDYANYKQTTTEALSEIGTTYATKTELGTETSNRQTAIQQVNDAIALKANASDVYTKQQTDGLISTEVSNRNSAIEQSAEAINLSVSQTYAKNVAGRNLLSGGAASVLTWTNVRPAQVTLTGEEYECLWTLVKGVGGWENVYSPAIPVEVGKTYTVSMDYSVESDYTPYGSDDNRMFGLEVCTQPGSTSNNFTNLLAKIPFGTTAKERTRGSATFTATTDTVYFHLDGGYIKDGMENKSFITSRLMLEEGAFHTAYMPPNINKNLASIEAGSDNLISSLPDYWQIGALNGSAYAYNVSAGRIIPITEKDSGRILSVSANAAYLFQAKDLSGENIQVYVGIHEQDSNGNHLKDSGWQLCSSEGYSFTTLPNTASIKLVVRGNDSTITAATLLGRISNGKLAFYFSKDLEAYTDSQITAAKAEIKVTTDGISSEVEKKTDKDTIISTIRQSAETVKIKASQVEIDGTAIFTAISSDVDDAITGKGYQTASQVDTAITSKGYATTGQAQGYASTAESNAKAAIPTKVSQLNNDSSFATTGQVATAKSEATTAANQATDQKLVSYSTTAQMNTAIGDAVDAIEVGGRNLLRGTSAPVAGGGSWTTATWRTSGNGGAARSIVDISDPPSPGLEKAFQFEYTTATTANSDFGYAQDNIPIGDTVEYTVSCYARAIDGSDQRIYFETYRNGGAKYSRYDVTAEWKRYSWTLNPTVANGYTNFYFGGNSHGIGAVQICGMKLEKGTKPTDWTSAPEDTDAAIASVKSTADAAAPKANAVKRTQRIYYRKSASGAPTTPGSWVTNGNTESGWTKYNAWSTRVPPIAESKAEGATKYLYLYTCEQREMADGTLAYTTVLLDDSTTVIDGGNIITGSVAANKLEVYDATIQKIRADAIDTASIIVGQDQVDGLDETLEEQIPTSMSQLENDSGYVTDGYVPAEIPAAIVKGELQADQIDVNSLRTALLQVANLLIGNTDEAHIVANGDRMSFMAGDHEVAYVQVDNEGGTFYMTRSIVVKDMQFGDGLWKWYKRDNNNMSLKWMGGM